MPSQYDPVEATGAVFERHSIVSKHGDASIGGSKSGHLEPSPYRYLLTQSLIVSGRGYANTIEPPTCQYIGS